MKLICECDEVVQFVPAWEILLKFFAKREQSKRKREEKMGYVLRVRLSSFFAGAAMASASGLYILYKDYKVAHESISHQVKGLHQSLDRRISALENLKQAEASQHVEATE